ncbi:MAG TPA: TonB family protein [Gemmatimonadales bacterium]|nr:TonB family protein [Gemmatimonadales bacterium]
MIAIWMLYASALSLCFGLAALALERAARLWARPRRFLWAVAIAASLLVPVAGLMIPGVPVPPRVAPGSVLVEDLVVGPPPASRAAPVGVSRTQRKIGPLIASLSRPLLLLWAGASLALALGLLRAGVTLRRRARGWHAAVVDGTEVLVAPDLGPAVVRLGGLRVVLPEWALAAEPAARSLMLLHENEHRAARDPDLLLGATVALMLVPWALPLWWQVRRLQLAVETDCDGRVMRAGADAHAYGVLLLSVGARSTSQPLLAPTAFSEARTLLERRIEAMTSPSPKWRLVRTALATGAGTLVVAAACMTPRPAPAPTPQRERVYAEDSVTERPRMLHHPQLAYPDSLKAAGIGGHVLLEAVIDTTGRVDSGSVRTVSSSHPAFEAVARDVVVATTFRPGRLDGRAVAVRVRIPFNFSVTPGPPAPQPPPGVYREDSVTERPRLLSRPPLTFPDSLRAFGDSLRESGVSYRVYVEAIVDSTGHADAGSVRILASWHPGFDAAARAAVIASTYAPGRIGGRAVPVMIRFPIEVEPPSAPAPQHR